MRLAELWPEVGLIQELLHKLPWFHPCTIIDKAVDYRDWSPRQKPRARRKSRTVD